MKAIDVLKVGKKKLFNEYMVLVEEDFSLRERLDTIEKEKVEILRQMLLDIESKTKDCEDEESS